MKHAKSLKCLAALGTVFVLAGCITSATHFSRENVAMRLATPAWMVDRIIPAGQFHLMAWERMHERFKPADIYIEGDGEALSWMSPDATPDYPVGLHLAAYDKAENVAFIAQPCQYTGMSNGEDCPESLYAENRYSPAVIEAYNKALDNIIAQYNIRGINLITYGGSGAIAAELLKTRSDIITWRSVADKLDKVAVDPKLATVPQHHFIGGQDETVMPPELHNYLQAVGPSACVHHSFIQENEHEDGWAEKWPELLKEPIECPPPPAPEFDFEEVLPKRIYTPRDTSFKDPPK